MMCTNGVLIICSFWGCFFANLEGHLSVTFAENGEFFKEPTLFFSSLYNADYEMYKPNKLNGEKNSESHLFYKKSPICDLLFLEISPSSENPQVQLSVNFGLNWNYPKFSLALDLANFCRSNVFRHIEI